MDGAAEPPWRSYADHAGAPGPGHVVIGSLNALEGQRELIKAALAAAGPRPVVDRLAKMLDAWVLLLDTRGELQRCAPEHARRHHARIGLDIDRFNTTAAASLSVGGEGVAVLPISARHELGGFLVVGRRKPLSRAERSVLTTAIDLLALDLTRDWDLLDGQRRACLAVVQLAVAGHPELASQAADTLGVALPETPLRVAVLGAPQEHRADLLQAAETHQGLRVAGALAAEYEPGFVVVLLPVAEGDLLALEEVLHQVPRTRGAVSEGVVFRDLPDAWRRARSVFFDAPEAVGALLTTRDVASAGLLAQLKNPNALGWASTLLEPLERGRSDLTSTLRVFLAHNGQIEASAAVLGIHRHTLRYRLDRITEVLGRELDDPTTRAELWIALRLRESR